MGMTCHTLASLWKWNHPCQYSKRSSPNLGITQTSPNNAETNEHIFVAKEHLSSRSSIDSLLLYHIQHQSVISKMPFSKLSNVKIFPKAAFHIVGPWSSICFPKGRKTCRTPKGIIAWSNLKHAFLVWYPQGSVFTRQRRQIIIEQLKKRSNWFHSQSWWQED